jgi:hypothetical protein
MQFIKKFKKCLSREECEEIINYYKENDFSNSKKRRSNLNYSVKEFSLDVKNNLFWKEKFKKIKNKADINLRSYLSFNSSCGYDSYYFKHMCIMHHQEMNTIPYHYDCEIEKKEDGVNVRVFAILIYLNNNFEGGELVFPIQKKVIKPEPGLMLIFPTSFMYPHVTTPALGNDRFVLRLNYYIDTETFI